MSRSRRRRSSEKRASGPNWSPVRAARRSRRRRNSSGLRVTASPKVGVRRTSVTPLGRTRRLRGRTHADGGGDGLADDGVLLALVASAEQRLRARALVLPEQLRRNAAHLPGRVVEAEAEAGEGVRSGGLADQREG